MIEAPFLENISATYFATPSVGSSVPAIDEKRVYCAAGMSEDGNVNGVVIAFDKNSLRQIWRTELSSGVGDSAIKLYDGFLYVCNNNGPICLNCETGEIIWECILTEKYSAYSFQEITPSVAHDGLFVGSPFGVCYKIDRLTGAVLGSYDTGSHQIFYGAPLLFNNYSYWASMDGNFYSISRYEFELEFHLKLKFYEQDMSGCFAEPRIAFNEIACVTQGGEVVLITFDGKIKCADKGYSRFIAASTYVDTRMVVADIDGNVKWLIENLSPYHSVNLYGKFLFGTPQVFGKKVVVTTYGNQTVDEKGRSTADFSYIYVLEHGKIVESYRIPIRMHALSSVRIDDNGDIYAQLTGFVGDTSSKFCVITRIELPSLKDEYNAILEKKLHDEKLALEAQKAKDEAIKEAQKAEEAQAINLAETTKEEINAIDEKEIVSSTTSPTEANAKATKGTPRKPPVKKAKTTSTKKK